MSSKRKSNTHRAGRQYAYLVALQTLRDVEANRSDLYLAIQQIETYIKLSTGRARQ